MIISTLIILIITVTPPSQGNRGDSHCELHAAWTGRWFESGEREPVTVRMNNITHKGECVYQKGDKYIFKDEKQHCYRCAVMHQKHHNVLQYKESFCEPTIGRRQLDLCYQITADSPLKSMFRLDIDQFEDCPIDGAYSFTYSRGHGLCEYPKSSMSQCSDKSKLVFRYQACADIKGSESSMEEVQCVAQWKEGSTFYFLGLLNHSHVLPTDYENRFRCFAYQNIYEGFLVSQSGEAVCTLYTAKEGDRTMTLKKVQNYDESCQLPKWLHDVSSGLGYVYENLNGTKKYHIKPRSIVITHKHHHEHVGSSLIGHMKSRMTLECNSVEQNTNKFAKMVMKVSFDCESGFVCLEINQKSENILTLRQGRLSRNQDEACNTQLFFDANIKTTTIINSNQVSQRCPLVGKYSLRRRSSDMDPGESCKFGMTERENLMFGCSGESEFNLVTRCRQESDDPEVHTAHFEEFLSEEAFSCLGGWKESSLNPDLIVKNVPKDKNAVSEVDKSPSVFSPITQYMIVMGPHKTRHCLRLTSTRDNDRSDLIATENDCLGIEDSNELTAKNAKLQGKFVLSRQSECAQALATANTATSPFHHVSVLSMILPTLFSMYKIVFILRSV